MVKIKKQYNKKYKIMDVKINKQLKNDEIILRCIHTGGTDVDEHPKPTTRELLIEFMIEQRGHNASVDSRLDAMDAKITDTANLLNKVIKLNNLKTE